MSKYIFIKNSGGDRPRNISKQEYFATPYGQTIEFEPVDNPLKIYHFSGSITGSDEYNILYSLKNTINRNSGKDEIYNFSNFYNNPCSIFCFNSLNLGSGIQKGDFLLEIYISGSRVASCSDFREDGILYESGSDNKVGIILYNEGFVLLNNTTALSEQEVSFSSNENFFDKMRWVHTFISSSDPVYYNLEYKIKNEVPTSTFFIYANKNEFNHSNNQTYIQTGSIDQYCEGNYWSADTNKFFHECKETKIKNTVKSPFLSGSANFEKQTFITKIGLYDSSKKLIGLASLANPIKKTENREFLFKLKIDL